MNFVNELEAHERLAGGEASLSERNHRLPQAKALRSGRSARNVAHASTHLSLHYHVVFSTKNRESWLNDSVIDRIHEYIGGTVRGRHGVAHAVGGIADHAHVFMGLRATHCLADVMREIKSESSKWTHRELQIPGFEWQEGYGAFTVSASHIDAVRSYVLNQAEHHRLKTFQEEYLTMLHRVGGI